MASDETEPTIAPDVRQALENDFTVDLSTVGRHSGDWNRIEIWMLHIGGRFFITGTPGPRDWLANVRSDPRVIVHVKQQVHGEVAGRAVEVTDGETRRSVFEHRDAEWYRGQTALDVLVAEAPMIELLF